MALTKEEENYRPRRRKIIKWCLLAGLLFLLAYPFFVERYLVQVNHYKIAVPNLPPAFSGIRVVQISDLHYGALVPRSFVQSLISRVNKLYPDLIICTGDYVHEFRSTKQIDEVWPLLAQLKAPMGVYSVLGNHDHWADSARSIYWLNKTGQGINHKKVRLERAGQFLWLVGAGDFYEDHKNLDIVLDGIPEKDCRVVLAHNPDTADTNYSKRIDLFVSGHTQGGQVSIPSVGPLILPVKNKNYSSGLKESNRGCKVFISKGIGWAIFPVRFNCFPEIAVLELVPENGG